MIFFNNLSIRKATIIVCIAATHFVFAGCVDEQEVAGTAHIINTTEEPIYFGLYEHEKDANAANVLLSSDKYIYRIEAHGEYIWKIKRWKNQTYNEHYQFVFFKENTWNKYSRIELMENNIHDGIYHYTFESFKAVNFIFEYKLPHTN